MKSDANYVVKLMMHATVFFEVRDGTLRNWFFEF